MKIVDRVFVLRTIDDRDGTWSVDIFADQDAAEKDALERLESINRSDNYREVDGELEGIPLPPWTRWDNEDSIGWSPPEDGSWPGGGECVIWKAALDVPSPLAEGDKVYAIWIDRFDVEAGVRDMVYTTKEAAMATAKEIIEHIGGRFARHENPNHGEVMWNNWDEDNDDEVIIWERSILNVPT